MQGWDTDRSREQNLSWFVHEQDRVGPTVVTPRQISCFAKATKFRTHWSVSLERLSSQPRDQHLHRQAEATTDASGAPLAPPGRTAITAKPGTSWGSWNILIRTRGAAEPRGVLQAGDRVRVQRALLTVRTRRPDAVSIGGPIRLFLGASSLDLRQMLEILPQGSSEGHAIGVTRSSWRSFLPSN